MARTDWALHRAQFERYKADNPALTLVQYCENNDLNPATARRHIKSRSADTKRAKPRSSGTKKSAQKRAVQKTTKPAKATAGKGSGKGRGGTKAGEKTKSSPEGNPKYQKKSEKKSPSKQVSSPKKSKTAAQKRREKNRADGFDRPVKSGRLCAPFNPGNRVAMKHGAYAQPESIDQDLWEAALVQCGTGASFVEVNAVAKYLQAERFAAELQAEVDDQRDYLDELKEKHPKELDAEALQAIDMMPSRRKKKADIFVGLTSPTNSLLMTAHVAYNDRRKNNLKYHELHPLNQAQRLQRQAELFGEIVVKKLEPVEAARLFEMEGLEVPAILAQEAKHEISLREPEMGAEPQVSEEEKEERRQKFIKGQVTIMDKVASEKSVLHKKMESQMRAGDLDGEEFIDADVDIPEQDTSGVTDFDDSEDPADQYYDVPDEDFD